MEFLQRRSPISSKYFGGSRFLNFEALHDISLGETQQLRHEKVRILLKEGNLVNVTILELLVVF